MSKTVGIIRYKTEAFDEHSVFKADLFDIFLMLFSQGGQYADLAYLDLAYPLDSIAKDAWLYYQQNPAQAPVVLESELKLESDL